MIVSVREESSIGPFLARIRENAGLSQAQLAKEVTFSTATLSRIESGEKFATDDEMTEMLNAIGTDEAKDLGSFVKQNWDELARPPFDHPNRQALWEANSALRKLAILRQDKDLKAVFLRQIDLYDSELRRIAIFLNSREHQVAFIGSIGVGKSTAICKLTGLLKLGEEKLDRQIVLETGAGGITLCEVHISQGPRYGLRVIPRVEDSIRRDVEDFCDYLMASTRQPSNGQTSSDEEDGDPLGISKEVVRAIRNMADLTEKRREENGKRIRIDPAKELAKQLGNVQELCIHILTKMDLLRRNKRDEWYPENHPQSPAQWLQELFSAVNNGRHLEFSLPQKIEIIIPDAVFASRELPIRIVDTKGIDQTAERQDLECHFDDPRTLVVLCSRFNDAPEVALQSLLRRAKEAGTRDICRKTVLFVLPRPDEALAVKHDDGVRVEDDCEGYDLKRDQIHLRLNQQGLADVSVEFFNARDENPKGMRDRFIAKLMEHRQHYAEQISRLSAAVDRLNENREDEQIRLVFEHVMSDLETWIQNNLEIDLIEEGVQKPLVDAIDATRHASTVRAAVRRDGDWYNLDYYHHLAHGVRVLGVEHIGKKIEAFKIIVNNQINNEDLAPAKGFLEGVIGRVNAAVDDSYRRVQLAGREAFKQTLAKDRDFWSKCVDRWGKGPGYRSAIRNMTDEEFSSEFLAEVHTLIFGLLEAEWNSIVVLMESLLHEEEPAASAA